MREDTTVIIIAFNSFVMCLISYFLQNPELIYLTGILHLANPHGSVHSKDSLLPLEKLHSSPTCPEVQKAGRSLII